MNQVQPETICETLRRRRGRPPGSQAALLLALSRAMGAWSGPQPDLRSLAVEMGISHQQLYRLVRALEEKGVLVRGRATLEIRLS